MTRRLVRAELSRVGQMTSRRKRQSFIVLHRCKLFGESTAIALARELNWDCRIWSPLGGSSVPPGEFDVALLDLHLPLDMLVAAKSSLGSHSACKLVLLATADWNLLFARASLATHGFISDDESLKAFVASMKSVADGQVCCSPKLTTELVTYLATHRPAMVGNGSGNAVSRLTAREREVLRCIALEDLSNKQLARKLHVSLYTIKNHVHNIIDKLGVTDRREAALACRDALTEAG